MELRKLAWWPFFTIIAIWFQHVLPGVDFFVVGLVLSLQEDRISTSAWLALFFLLIQEGVGSLPFGYGLLWYGAVAVLFALGRWLFEVENALFILLLSICLGALHTVLILLLSGLQNYEPNLDRLMLESVIQAVIIPPGWYIARSLRWRLCHAPTL